MFNRKAVMFSNVTLQQIREGSRVIVRDNFGTGAPREVTVLTVDSDIKNGRPGIDYDNSWAYLTQVDRVVKY
jgi:hypothetical protein